jgi:hypothetical protein
MTADVTATFTGTFDGIWEATETDVFYPGGSVTVQTSGVFSGSVEGSDQGTAQWTGIGTGGFHDGSTLSLQNVIGQGTDGLEGLHANLTFGLPSDLDSTEDSEFRGTATYGGQFQFAPPQ